MKLKYHGTVLDIDYVKNPCFTFLDQKYPNSFNQGVVKLTMYGKELNFLTENEKIDDFFEYLENFYMNSQKSKSDPHTPVVTSDNTRLNG